MYVRPRLAASSEPTTFGVSGKLWRSALILYDRQTLSLWAQIGGQAVAGPSSGHQLAEIPAELTTWSRWKRNHPDTLVLVKPAIERSPYRGYQEEADFAGIPWMRHRDQRLPEKELVLGIQAGEGEGEEALALPITVAHEQELLHLEIAGRPLLIVSAGLEEPLRVFDRRVDGAPLNFSVGSDLKDKPTGSTWDRRTGMAKAGFHKGKQLERVAVSPVYFGIWVKYYPETGVFKGS